MRPSFFLEVFFITFMIVFPYVARTNMEIS
jgi:hypothetical protein